MAYQPLPKEDLRLGLFIKIVGNWFSHPFPKNAFKIKTEKELATLRALEKYQFQYDPARSDALPPSNQEGESFQDQAPAPDSPDSMSAEEDSHDVSPDLDLGNPQVMSEKRRDQLKEAERSYQHVLQENKASIREVKEGYAKGIGKAESLITTLGEIKLSAFPIPSPKTHLKLRRKRNLLLSGHWRSTNFNMILPDRMRYPLLTKRVNPSRTKPQLLIRQIP